MNNLINAAILGSTGYTGLELINILEKHPNASIKFLGSKSSHGKSINTFDKRFSNFSLPNLNKLENIKFNEYDVVFLALPHIISQNIVKDNIGKTIFIDLSADFRLDNAQIYKSNYNAEHKCPNLLNKFVYGLPEINIHKIKNSKNIAVPGCYPTSVLLPLIPLLKQNFIVPNNIIIDSKSGYSGAGKSYNTSNIYKNDIPNFYNYKTNNHRHICEIKQELEKSTSKKVYFSFNPHVLPLFRGMMSTIYCDLNANYKKEDVFQLLQESYNKASFVKILNDNQDSDIYSVYKTNDCLIKIFNHYDDNKIILTSTIDNLIKGASGQAIQCMNIIFGLNESTGLENLKSD